MYQQFRPQSYNFLPPVVKNLLIINGLFFLATAVLQYRFGISLIQVFGMPFFSSPGFEPYQLATHMFMHGDIGHIFSNMFALWMFGSVLENVWGGKRFLIYYLGTAIGAALIYNLSRYIDILQAQSLLSEDQIKLVYAEGYTQIESGYNYRHALMAKLNAAINSPVVGASGAVFGVLLAFGMLFPNTELYLFFAIPIKAKFFVAGYALLELYLGIKNDPTDQVAHFAHLGGMLIGYFIVKYWNKNNRRTLF